MPILNHYCRADLSYRYHYQSPMIWLLAEPLKLFGTLRTVLPRLLQFWRLKHHFNASQVWWAGVVSIHSPKDGFTDPLLEPPAFPTLIFFVTFIIKCE